MNPGPDSPQQDPAAASAEPDAAVPSVRPRRGPSWPVLVGVALVVMLLVRGFLLQSFYVPSGSMEPTIQPGDRILVNKLVSGDALHRGDVVVFDGTTTFAAADLTPRRSSGLLGRVLGGAASAVGVDLGEQDFVKRIIGLPGDHVVCCDTQGRITINGTAVQEPYIMSGDKPSDLTFDITVPAGRLWVMGDHRSDSADSRAHLGDPGGGTVRLSDVVGRAAATYWPLSRIGGFDTPAVLADIPRAVTK
ncbi:signal peptidase I [Nostocoides sp. HKS02]|uniref:signal peptidase I n=1 Tax=Nostocoides sp. HKS02 TaxID=1813880 RepID=UPI0012B4FE5C|nr:signal peptidase I [Tetrasphaera sp. HKS02]QGN57821.1 signal peptidase I [Tetrasphaera sp. HKS02]